MAKTILIVDDEAEVRGFYRDCLREAGYRVRTAADGRQCLEAVEKERPDLVLLDVLLPVQTGYDILEVLKANWPEMPVVLVSGKVDRPTREALNQLGAEEFLEKPVDGERLLGTVRRVVGPAD